MDQKRSVPEKKEYEPPRVLASYEKKDLEAALKPHAQVGGSGCGCGGS